MIAILDASSFFFACLAMAILIGSGKNGILSGDRKFVVGGLILFMGIYYFCIFAKWANISKSLEIFEDFGRVLDSHVVGFCVFTLSSTWSPPMN